MSYYNYDHLGNTRVVFHSVINCAADSVHYVLEYAADYYPFGSILREWSNCEKSRFLFTYKERDAETGWDNLGARLYDSDVCRFLGVDALGDKFMEWTPYACSLDNPITFIDPNGMAAVCYDHEYSIDKAGYIKKEKHVEGSTVDRIHTKENWDKNKFDASITIKDQELLKTLESNEGKLTAKYMGIGKGIPGTYAITRSAADAFKVFKFASDHSL